MKKLLSICTAAALISGFSAVASAQVIVGGDGPQRICYEKALYGNTGTKTAIDTCNEAVKAITSRKNKTATHINRGILLMRSGDHPAARADFEKAISLRPKLPQTYVNYGAVLIYMNDYDGALKALNTAMESLETKDLHEALFNRALAYDGKMQYREAYLDLKRALELRPDWEAAQKAISRYTVETKTAG